MPGTDPRPRGAEPRELDTNASGPGANIWWGIIGLIAVEITVFSALIASYFYYEANSTAWPPEDPPSLRLPTINTFVLIGSSVAIAFADRGIRDGRQGRLKTGLLASIVFALVFLLLKGIELSENPYHWDTHAYGSIVWMMLGLHTLHVVSVLLKSSVMAVLAFKGYFSERRYVGVQVNGLYWHFVVVIWVPIYLTIYVSPRLGG